MESIEYVRLHLSTTSAAVAAISTIPALSSSAAKAALFSALRFHTTRERPERSRLRAWPIPMMPRPMNPTGDEHAILGSVWGCNNASISELLWRGVHVELRRARSRESLTRAR